MVPQSREQERRGDFARRSSITRGMWMKRSRPRLRIGKARRSDSRAKHDRLMCEIAVLSPAAKDHIRYLPGGRHLIRQFGELTTVEVTEQLAAEMEAQRRLLCAVGQAPFFGFSHSDSIAKAAFWVHEFLWREGERGGVWARGSFSPEGRAFCAKKTRYFSPECHREDKWPHKIVARLHDKGNIGAVIGHWGSFGAKLTIPALDG